MKLGIIGAMQVETEGLIAEMTEKKTDTVSGVIYNIFEEVILPIRPRVAQIKRTSGDFIR